MSTSRPSSPIAEVGTGAVSVTIHYAEDLPHPGGLGRRDTYCLLSMGGKCLRTRTAVDGGCNPMWHETLSALLTAEDTIEILIKVSVLQGQRQERLRRRWAEHSRQLHGTAGLDSSCRHACLMFNQKMHGQPAALPSAAYTLSHSNSLRVTDAAPHRTATFNTQHAPLSARLTPLTLLYCPAFRPPG